MKAMTRYWRRLGGAIFIFFWAGCGSANPPDAEPTSHVAEALSVSSPERDSAADADDSEVEASSPAAVPPQLGVDG